MVDQKPVGIFDSGLGGLSILNAIRKRMPYESFVYFADSAFCPYGSRSVKEVQYRSQLITDFLLKEKAKIIVVACNTATASAIDMLRETYSVPFIGIEPAIKQAAMHTESGKVGVLATKNTLQGRLFKETSAKFAFNKDVFIQVGNGLVEIVEEDKIESEESEFLLKKYINPMIKAGVDQIVLGCTHYPFLIPKIKEIIPSNIYIHDPSPAVAKQTEKVLKQFKLQATQQLKCQDKFYTTGNIEYLKSMVSRLGFKEESVFFTAGNEQFDVKI